MTADDRLDQLEPLVAESLAVLDRHTAQLKQLGAAVLRLDGKVTSLAVAVAKQSDDINFLLREQAGMKTDVATLKTDVADLKTDVATLKTDVADLKTDVGEIKTRLNTMDTKFELIIQLLQKPRN